MFVARFVDGPLVGAEHERVFVGSDRFDYLYLCPNPVPDSDLSWILVGFDGLEPDTEWPGQVTYRRIDGEPLHNDHPSDEPVYLFTQVT